MLRYLLVASVAVTSVNGTAPVQDEVFAAFPVIETGGKVIIPPLGVHAF